MRSGNGRATIPSFHKDRFWILENNIESICGEENHFIFPAHDVSKRNVHDDDLSSGE